MLNVVTLRYMYLTMIDVTCHSKKRTISQISKTLQSEYWIQLYYINGVS